MREARSPLCRRTRNANLRGYPQRQAVLRTDTVRQESDVRFSEAFGIGRDAADDWFDPLLLTDTKLFVDPFRIWVDESDEWSGAHDSLVSFFDMVLALIAKSNGDYGHPAWKKAERLLLFPEPNEFCLGYSEGLPIGSGSGKGLRTGIMLGAVHAKRVGARVKHVEELTLFQEGLGADRISDIACNVLKSSSREERSMAGAFRALGSPGS